MINWAKHNKDTILILFVGALVTGLGAYFFNLGMPWYEHELVLPFFAPARWMLPPFVFFIFSLCTLAALVLCRAYRHTLYWRALIGLFVVNACLTVGWAYLFFIMKSPALALLDLIVLHSTFLMVVALTWHDAREVSLLLFPYGIGIFFTLLLNYRIFVLN